MADAPLTPLLAAHRSIRRFDPRPVAAELIDQTLQHALQGTSSSGNLNMVSVIRTGEPERRQRLYELHGEQPMIVQAPWVLTFCADTFRTGEWLAARGARPGFVDLVSWHVAAFDAMIVAQTAALAFEGQGLGICYMGTTLFAMRELARFLECPPHCLPVTSLVVGWPDEAPAQRDRLPPAAWIHAERYQHPGPAEIDAHYAERDRRGRERYMQLDSRMAELWREYGIESLAQFYTSRIKYDPDRIGEYSKDLEALLREQGFLGGSGG